MATFTVQTKQQQRTDTSAKWGSKNPVLLVGELGIESNTGKIKCGNGIAHWNSLPYIGITTEYLQDNYVKKTGNASSATKLETARTIGMSGVTSSAKAFDGTANLTIPITSVPTSLLSGSISVSKITISSNSGLGYKTNLQDALNYIANVFKGSQSVSKIKANTFDTN